MSDLLTDADDAVLFELRREVAEDRKAELADDGATVISPTDDRAGRVAPAAPDAPAVFHRSETADAEPAVPEWRFPVDELFR